MTSLFCAGFLVVVVTFMCLIASTSLRLSRAIGLTISGNFVVDVNTFAGNFVGLIVVIVDVTIGKT